MRTSSIRAQAAISAVIIVGSGLLAAAVALVMIVQETSKADVEAAAHTRAGDFVALLESGTDPAQIDIRLEPDVFVQIADDGEVLAASPGLETSAPPPDLDDRGTVEIDDPRGSGESFLAVSADAETPRGEYQVVVGRSLQPVREATRVVAVALGLALPLLLLIIGFATWEQIGRALAPVESIREQVAAISASELDRRIPPPGGDDEIARLAETMNQMLERLATSHERQQRLVSDASHEFRNPLAAIRQEAEAAIEHPDRVSVEELAAGVLPESVRLQRIAEDLLFLARADEQGSRVVAVEVDMDDIALEEAAVLKHTTHITVDTSKISAARTKGDRSQLQRALRNVADNAARYARSRVVFDVRMIAGAVVVGVDDDGPGVPRADRERIFERFARVDAARGRDQGGAGLGLAIVAEIVRAHGGTVHALDSPIGGTRIEIVLPPAGD